MNMILIPLIYVAVLVWDWRCTHDHITQKEQVLYLFFGILAFLSAFPAAYWEHMDHTGASLSGMLSLFIS